MRYHTLVAWAALLLGMGLAAHAATPVETFDIDLNPLIDRAAQHPSQFAVSIAKLVELPRDGAWVRSGEKAAWDYAIRIPGATSLAFHAPVLRLPAQGVLTVSVDGQTATYPAADLHRAELWSRMLPGDTLRVTIEVPVTAVPEVQFQISGFQAGYRSLGAARPDHPHYRSIKAQANAGCVENYQCDASSATADAANATVGLIISNAYYCSGTLLNNVPKDGTPYILTARHCQSGDPGGGDPGAAASVQVYWHATTPCGQVLQSINSASSPTNYGATTMVEQQDQWLIRMDAGPNYANAVFAGWDASGTTVNGGFTVQHSQGSAQQYTTWSGNAYTETVTAASLGLGYDSVFLGTVNSLGSVDHGASGSALFTASNQVVGSLSRAIVQQCPASPPPAPSDSTADALFTKLAATWNSTADATSTTGSATLASILDPGHTGTTTLAGATAPPTVRLLSSSGTSSQTGNPVTLQYVIGHATSCTASGGRNGDGWNGTVAPDASGNRDITETQAGSVTYTLTCVNGSRAASAAVTVQWSLAPPALSFSANASFYYAGNPVTLTWQSNQTACTPSGGHIGDGWSGSLTGSGLKNVTEAQAGTVTYTVTCGSGAQQISQSLSITYQAATAAISLWSGSPQNLRAGETITLFWSGSGHCVFTGGTAGDGWNGITEESGGSNFVFYVHETLAGTYNYTLSCGPVNAPATAHLSYTFSNAAPTATLTATQLSQLIDLQASSVPSFLTYVANLSPCSVDVAGPGDNERLISGYGPKGGVDQPEVIAGTYTYILTCGTGSATATSTATVNWIQPTPHVTLSAAGRPLPLDGAMITWSTNVLPCTGSGGAEGDGWTGPLPYIIGGLGGTSLMQIREPTAGTYHLTLTCGTGTTASAQLTVTLDSPDGGQLNFTASNPAQSDGTSGQTVYYTGQPVHLSWNSSVGSCTGYDGSGSDGWAGAHVAQGTVDLLTPPVGSYTYTLVCGSGTGALEAQVQIQVRTVDQVTAGLAASTAPYFVGKPATLHWTSGQATACTATGGVPGDGWGGALGTAGSLTLIETAAGQIDYLLTCRNGSMLSNPWTLTLNWQAVPTVTLTPSTTQAVLGTAFVLGWQKAGDYGTCTATEDGTAGSSGWSGVINGPSGAASVLETTGTTHTYDISCTGHYGTITAESVVDFTAAATGGTGGGGTGGSATSTSSSSGGGGEFSAAWLLVTAGLVAGRRRGRRAHA